MQGCNQFQEEKQMHVILVEPEIPQNTGNISRTCVLTDSELHLVKPLGFSLDDRHLKRAGLDYWPHLKLHLHDSFASLSGRYPEARFLFFSVKGGTLYTDFAYRDDDFLVFGSETSGFPEGFLQEGQTVLRMPMNRNIKRSLNLSNAVAIVLYEALRQQDFPG